jgi:hypothetical protein
MIDQLKSLASATNVPNWVSATAGMMMLIALGMSVWQQADEQFSFTDHSYQEFQRHFNETPETLMINSELLGSVKIDHYASDGCFLVTVPQRQPEWLVLQEIDFAASPLARRQKGHRAPPRPVLAGVGVVPQDYSCSPYYQNGCLGPFHPGDFESWTGDTFTTNDGATWTEIWRRFDDNCQHVQMLRQNDGYWDSNPDGSPRVCWTRCVGH